MFDGSSWWGEVTSCRLFGFNVESDARVPVSIPAQGPAALSIRRALSRTARYSTEFRFHLGDPAGGSTCVIQGSGDGALVDIELVGQFECGPTGIRYKLAAAVEDDVLAWHLFGFVSAIQLEVMGLRVLHGASLVSDQGAVILCGPSGMGKSSLALALIRRGWKLLGDDHAVLEPTTQGLVVRPAIPWMKATPETAAAFGLDWSKLGRLHPASSKRRVDFDTSRWWDHPVRARAIYLLRRECGRLHGPVRIARLRSSEAFWEVLAQSYALRSVEALGMSRGRVKILAELVNQTRCCLIHVPDGLGRLDNVVEALEVDLALV